MAHVYRRSHHDRKSLAGYGAPIGAKRFEDKVRRRAAKAERDGKTGFECDGTLYVKVTGRGFVEWSTADPTKIERGRR